MNSAWWVLVGAILALAFIYVLSPLPFFPTEEVVVLNVSEYPEPLPCQMYFRDDLALYAGKAASADEAVELVKKNIRRLKVAYSEKVKEGTSPDYPLGWGRKVFVKYRTQREKYQRNGWYVTASDDEGLILGEYYLSDEGLLMPAIQTCTRIGCCS
ncbi:MAG: hypothetical protein V1875_08040 [Candidatus Altiarchaeota archaeon]